MKQPERTIDFPPPPLVSIVIRYTMASVFLWGRSTASWAQTYTDFELIVVDDGSRDASVEIIRAYTKRDLRRLIDAMLAKNWVEPADTALMIADMKNRLEQARPRMAEILSLAAALLWPLAGAARRGFIGAIRVT